MYRHIRKPLFLSKEIRFMKKISAHAATFIAVLVIIAFSHQTLLAITNTPFHFLRTNISARAAGMAGCFVSVEDDVNGVFINPASISTVKDKNFSATFLKHVLDINSGSAVYLIKDNDLGNIALSSVFMSYGSFTRADANGEKTGSFSAGDVAFAATYSNELDSNLYYGATLKLIYSNIESASSFAFAVDAGMIYLMPHIRTNVGLSILHVGTQVTTFDGNNEKLPLDVRLGINHRLRGLPLLVNFSFHHLADNTDGFFEKFANFSLAGEFYLGEYIRARIGYDNQIRRYTAPENDKKFTGITAGVGIYTNQFYFDYGIAQNGVSATLHRFSVSLGI